MKLQKWCVMLTVLLLIGFVISLRTGAALAAELGNPENQTCIGSGTWHFVNNRYGGDASGALLTATFTCGTFSNIEPSKVRRGTVHFLVSTNGNCMLEDASTNLPGNLRLSDFICVPTPTPTPTPTPRPTPIP